MINKIYFDTFAREYVGEKDRDQIAPPERYIATYRSGFDAFIEHWVVSDAVGSRLDIAYSRDDYYDKKAHMRIYNAMVEEHHCKPSYLLSYSVPDDLFDDYLKRFNIEEGVAEK